MHDIPIAICISTWNRSLDLKRCIDCIYIQDYPQDLINIYVIDNCSVDNTLDIITSYPDINFHVMPHSNFTAIHTINKCLQCAYQSNYKYIIILDDDAFMINSNTVSNLVSNMESHDDMGICGCNVINLIGEKPSFDINLTLKDDPYDIKSPLREHPNFCGACAIFRSDVIGPDFYDESCELYWNEPELSIKTILNGYKVYYDQNTIVHHGSYVGRMALKRIYYATRNSTRFMNRYLDFKQRVLLVPLYIVNGYYDIIINKLYRVNNFKDLTYLVKFIYHSIKIMICIMKSYNYNVPSKVKNFYYCDFMTHVTTSFKSE